MVASNPFQCLTLSLLFIPPLLLTAYLLASFPHPPEALYLHPSLASLPSTSKTWSIYPEDFYPGGAYVTLPYGKVWLSHISLQSRDTQALIQVRYWLLGPEKGKKVSCVVTGGSINLYLARRLSWFTVSQSPLLSGKMLLLHLHPVAIVFFYTVKLTSNFHSDAC